MCLVCHQATAEGNNLTALSAAKDFYKREMSEVKCYTIYSHLQESKCVPIYRYVEATDHIWQNLN